MDGIATLFAAHHDAAVRLAYLHTGSTEHAEDVAAEVFAKLARSQPVMDHPGAYLRRSIVNEATSSWRRRLKERDHLSRGESAADLVAADSTDLLPERDRLWRVLQQLPPRQRTALVLRFYEDLSERSTAAVMGVSVGTVKSTTARGLAALRVLLDAEQALAA